MRLYNGVPGLEVLFQSPGKVELMTAVSKILSWITAHQRAWRAALLVLFVLAVLGPWAYTSDGVPPPNYCTEPNFLLPGPNLLCVGPVSGVEVLSFVGSVVLGIGAQLLGGLEVLSPEGSEVLRLALILLFIALLMLPFFTTLLLLWKPGNRRLQALQPVVWGLALVLSVWMPLMNAVMRSGRFWGLLLYLGLAASAIILELLAGRSARSVVTQSSTIP